MLVEIQERDRLALYQDVSEAVDNLVRGHILAPEIRFRDENNEIHIEKPAAPRESRQSSAYTLRNSGNMDTAPFQRHSPGINGSSERMVETKSYAAQPAKLGAELIPIRIYPFGIARNRLIQAARRLGVPALVVKELDEAQALVTMRTYYRNRQQSILDAEQRGTPIYVLRANTINQMEQFLGDLFNLPNNTPDRSGSDELNMQTRAAIEAVLNGERWVDLPPANATVRRLQHEMARQAQLVSQSFGKEPHRRVRIYRD
jgi:hypothetical protein